MTDTTKFLVVAISLFAAALLLNAVVSDLVIRQAAPWPMETHMFGLFLVPNILLALIVHEPHPYAVAFVWALAFSVGLFFRDKRPGRISVAILLFIHGFALVSMPMLVVIHRFRDNAGEQTA